MAETDFKYDVFISYSHKDEVWVRNVLLPTLEKQGLKVCIDYRDFIAGKPAIINMQDASEASRHTLLVLTPRWVESEWTLYESILSRTDDPSGLQRRTIPLLLEKCKPPKFISMLTWVDFTDKKRETEAWQNLFKSLDKEVEKVEVAKAEPDSWYLAHPYPMPPNFTGRATELKMLDDWLANDKDRIFILRALGGFGKSALAWQWINTHVDPSEWTKLIFWSFYEGDASFEHFIEETLKYLKLEIPQGQRPQVDALLKAMQSQKILLIMDGFERALRAYSSMNAAYQRDEESPSPASGRGDRSEGGSDCINLNAEIFIKHLCSLPNIKSKVLMTTRLTPRAVKPRGEFMLGCREVELTSMQPSDAVEFFHKQNIKGTHAEIEAACASYGYHPLSLRLLAGRILKDFENPADIVVAQRLKIDGDVVQQKHHVLEVSYKSLPLHGQKLLSTIACFRSPVELKTLQSIAENKISLDTDLHDLVDRGLLHHTIRLDSNHLVSTFDLHPIVRRYAYEHLTIPDRTAAHTRLAGYFEAVPEPAKIEKLEDLAPVIELYHHMVRAGKLDEAFVLYRDRLDTLYYQLGAYQLIIELMVALFIDGEDKTPRLKDESFQAWTLNELANAYALSGQPRRAVPLFLLGNEPDEKSGNKKGVAIGLGNVANMAQIYVGALKEAERNLQRAISLSQDSGDELYIGFWQSFLGQVLVYCGRWKESEESFHKAEQMEKEADHIQAQSVNWSYRALRFLLMAREEAIFKTRKSNNEYQVSAIECAKHALELADEDTKQRYTHPRDYVRTHWLLGAAYRSNNDLTLAEGNLSKALNLCRQINLVDHEADIVLDLARLRYAQNDFRDAQEKASEALTITERSEYVLQGADVNLFLAEFTLTLDPSPEGRGKARAFAETALKLATCDGPPYYYKVAYEEAERLIAQLQG